MSLRNPFGDLELTDPKAMRALAHPTRLAILTRLQRYGAATATQLSEHVEASPSVVSWHLRHLADFGLVGDAESPDGDRRRRWWQARAPGISVSLPDTAEGQGAARLLMTQMHVQAIAEVQRWEVESEPALPERWRKAAGSGNTGLRITLAELRRLESDINALLASYTSRESAPRGARDVRVIRFLLPEAGDSR